MLVSQIEKSPHFIVDQAHFSLAFSRCIRDAQRRILNFVLLVPLRADGFTDKPYTRSQVMKTIGMTGSGRTRAQFDESIAEWQQHGVLEIQKASDKQGGLELPHYYRFNFMVNITQIVQQAVAKLGRGAAQTSVQRSDNTYEAGHRAVQNPDDLQLAPEQRSGSASNGAEHGTAHSDQWNRDRHTDRNIVPGGGTLREREERIIFSLWQTLNHHPKSTLEILKQAGVFSPGRFETLNRYDVEMWLGDIKAQDLLSKAGVGKITPVGNVAALLQEACKQGHRASSYLHSVAKSEPERFDPVFSPQFTGYTNLNDQLDIENNRRALYKQAKQIDDLTQRGMLYVMIAEIPAGQEPTPTKPDKPDTSQPKAKAASRTQSQQPKKQNRNNQTQPAQQPEATPEPSEDIIESNMTLAEKAIVMRVQARRQRAQNKKRAEIAKAVEKGKLDKLTAEYLIQEAGNAIPMTEQEFELLRQIEPTLRVRN